MKGLESAPISAAIICCNEEKRIRATLESLSFCQEIVVVDSGSTDRTLEIVREFTDKIIVRPWPGHVAQKQFALEQCSCPWVLSLDSDEVVSADLRKEIVETVQSNPKEDGFFLLRVIFFQGRFWRRGGWYPEYRLRLVRREKMRWTGDDPHDRAEAAGPTRRLKGELFHYTYDGYRHQIDTLNNFSTLAAQSLKAQGQQFSYLKLFFNPIFRFIKFYLIKLGFLEGVDGLAVALFESLYAFLKYLKLRELYKKDQDSSGKHT